MVDLAIKNFLMFLHAFEFLQFSRKLPLPLHDVKTFLRKNELKIVKIEVSHFKMRSSVIFIKIC